MSENARQYLTDCIFEAIKYAEAEFDITTAEIIGTLEAVKFCILHDRAYPEPEGDNE